VGSCFARSLPCYAGPEGTGGGARGEGAGGSGASRGERMVAHLRTPFWEAFVSVWWRAIASPRLQDLFCKIT
jgi:hypothetical protein